MKQITKDTDEFANSIIQLSTQASFAGKNLDDLATQCGKVDKSVISAAKSLQSGRINPDSFRDVANSATTSVTGFVAGLKSIAVNMAIFFAISTAIQLVGKAIDALVVTTEGKRQIFRLTINESSYYT